MANDVAQNPLVIDTTATVVAAGQPVQIAAVKVVGLATAADTCLIADANDNQFYEHKAGGTNESTPLEDFTGLHKSKRTLNGLKVTLSSGKVYIYLA